VGALAALCKDAIEGEKGGMSLEKRLKRQPSKKSYKKARGRIIPDRERLKESCDHAREERKEVD